MKNKLPRLALLAMIIAGVLALPGCGDANSSKAQGTRPAQTKEGS